MQNPSILIVEDEAVVALDLKLQLQDLGYQVAGIAASGEKALEAAARHAPNLVLMDVRLQGAMDGIEAARLIKQRHDIPLIFLTSHSDDDTVTRAARAAPYGYLTKPYQIKELRAGIEVALTKARMERQLREADRWFAHTLRCVADGVIVTDLHTKVRFLNPAAEALTGWPSEEASGRALGEVVHMPPGPQAAPQVAAGDAAALVQEVLRAGRPAPVAHARTLLGREGTPHVVDVTAGPVVDDTGHRLGAVLVLRDVGERVAQEARLRASDKRFRDAFDHAPLGMALVSLPGQFIQVNDALCRLLAMPREELLRLRQADVTLAADLEHEAERLRELERSPETVVQFEKRYLGPGRTEPVCTLASVSVMKDQGPDGRRGDEQATCYLYQVHDLSEQKVAAERLAALTGERMRREASELASASKTEFLSRVSHEMRTPLNAVIGFSQLLQLDQGRADPTKTRAYVEHIRTAGEHLLALVQDLLDLQRPAQGAPKVELVALPLAAVVGEALELVRGHAQAQSLRLVAQVAPQLLVQANAQRLRQVLLNITSNAIKYSRPGGTVTLTASTASPGRVALVIEDQGIGMTAAQQERLFQPFDRLGAERTTVPGTGLGLVITRSLVLEMGGTLEVTSKSQVGTRVAIELAAG